MRGRRRSGGVSRPRGREHPAYDRQPGAARNENDDVISETEENGDITSSEYEDEKNPYLPTSETTTNGNDFISQTVYEYDPKGNVISETDKGENKKEETKTVTSYDDHERRNGRKGNRHRHSAG